MGMLVEGVWKDVPRDTRKTGGEFVRTESVFRDRVTADGSSGFKAEAGRYHLYVSLSCPWAHRTVIYRALKGLERAISLSAVDPLSGPNGWTFSGSARLRSGYGERGALPLRGLRQGAAGLHGRVTVPALWDRKTGTIVNNESSEIIRMLNREFDALRDEAAARPVSRGAARARSTAGTS